MSTPRAPHIGLYGQCGFGNMGNDTTLEVVFDHLRATVPEARLTPIVRVPEVVSAKLGVPATTFYPPPAFGAGGTPRPFRRLANEAARAIAAARFIAGLDYLVFAGGGRFDDFNAEALGQPYWKWKWISLATMLGVPVEYLAIGAGPVDLPLSRWFYRQSGRMARRRSFRDEDSKRFAHDVLRIDTARDEVVTDLVFAWRAPRVRPPRFPARTIGLGVMEYNNRRGAKGGADDLYPSYMARLARLARALLARGYDLRILIGETCDLSAARDLHAAIAPDHPGRVTLTQARDLNDVARDIGACDAVIATRYHNVVTALALGRPVYSIGYAVKNDVLMQDFGLGAFCASIETFAPDEVAAQVDQMLERGPFHAAAVARRAAIHARLAQRALDGLTERVRARAQRAVEAARHGRPATAR